EPAPAIGPIRASSFRDPLLKYVICLMMYSAGIPAMSADSGCPWPDIRWHEPHAFGIGPLTLRGGAGGPSGNQSGGFAWPATAVASSPFAAPGARTVAGTLGSGGCTLSGMLKA